MSININGDGDGDDGIEEKLEKTEETIPIMTGTPVQPNKDKDIVYAQFNLLMSILMSILFSFTGVFGIIALFCTLPAAICAKKVNQLVP